MELIILLVAVGLLYAVWKIFFNKKTVDQTEQAPYKVETPESKPALDPVAVALDLEPIVLSKTTVQTETPEAKPKRTRAKKLDVNKDGKVDIKDAAAAIKKVTKARKTRSKKS